MKIEIGAAAAQAFMAVPLATGREGTPLNMGSALARLGIDPWSLAAELAAAARGEAATRLAALLERVPGGIPHAEAIAHNAVAALPRPTVEGAGLGTTLRLAAHDRELVGALVCFAATLALAVLMSVALVSGDPIYLAAGYAVAALAWASPWLGEVHLLRPLLAVASVAVGGIFAAVG
jgi:hypothetical protein